MVIIIYKKTRDKKNKKGHQEFKVIFLLVEETNAGEDLRILPAHTAGKQDEGMGFYAPFATDVLKNQSTSFTFYYSVFRHEVWVLFRTECNTKPGQKVLNWSLTGKKGRQFYSISPMSPENKVRHLQCFRCAKLLFWICEFSLWCVYLNEFTTLDKRQKKSKANHSKWRGSVKLDFFFTDWHRDGQGVFFRWHIQKRKALWIQNSHHS